MCRKLQGFIYRNAVKPIFFLQNPEVVHDHALKLGERLGKSSCGRKLTNCLFNYKNPILTQKVNKISFENPVGLAAGFDKNARLLSILRQVGFGFAEVGSITGEPCEGNPKPRLWRLPKDNALVVYYGLANNGCEEISARLAAQFKKKQPDLPVGISIAKTNNKLTCDTDKGVADYAKAYSHFKNIGSYDTINISCPNAFGGQPFHEAKKLNALFSRLNKDRSKKPIFLKISPDLSKKEIDAIIKSSRDNDINGFICSNLTHNIKGLKSKEIPKVGGISGNAVAHKSTGQLRYIRSKTGDEFTLIGVGGIFSAEDAYEKIKSGASLLQLITSMIFRGPQNVGEINKGLVKLLKKDGFSKLSDAVGSQVPV